MNRQVDMSAFIGVKFDCEINDDRMNHWIRYPIPSHFSSMRHKIKPRINKPQVLNNWGWVPDGLVWNAYINNPEVIGEVVLTSKQLRDATTGENFCTWAECIGVEADYSEWAKDRNMEVVNEESN